MIFFFSLSAHGLCPDNPIVNYQYGQLRTPSSFESSLDQLKNTLLKTHKPLSLKEVEKILNTKLDKKRPLYVLENILVDILEKKNSKGQSYYPQETRTYALQTWDNLWLFYYAAPQI